MNLVRYDERIWEELGPRVELRTREILVKIQGQIAGDRSLDRLPSKRQIVWQRADCWVQQLYDACCEVYKNLARGISDDFDRVVWVYCIEPFILRNVEETTDLGQPGLLELLLRSMGSPPEEYRSRRTGQNSWCLNVRLHIFEAWRKRLLHLQEPTQTERAAAALAAYNARERYISQVVSGLPLESRPLPQASAGRGQTLAEQPQPITAPTKAVGEKSDSAAQELPKEKNQPLPRKQFDYSNLMNPASLTELQSECYSLRHEYQLTVAEIARRLGRDRKTIQEHIDSAEVKIKISASKERAKKHSARFGID